MSLQNEDSIADDDIVKFRDMDIILRGAFKIVFYDKDVLSSDDIMCWCWLHSAISARDKYIFLERDEVDGAVKDTAYKHFAHNFSLEFWFEAPIDTEKEKQIEPNLNDWISNNSQNEWPQNNNNIQQRNNGYNPISVEMNTYYNNTQQPEQRRKRKKNHRAVTKPVMRNYKSGPVDNLNYNQQQQHFYNNHQDKQQRDEQKKRKKMHRTSTRPVMRNIKSANSPSSPRQHQAYDNNLDVMGDTDFDKHLRKQQNNKPKLMQNVQSLGSIHEQNIYNKKNNNHRNIPTPPKRKRKKKNNRAVSKPMLRNNQSVGLQPNDNNKKLKKRYSNPNAAQIHNIQQNELFKQQQQRNNAYNPISIRLNTYDNNQQQYGYNLHNQQQNRFNGQYHDNHHYQNGNAVQPISVNDSMMNTLRQNMQHHLSPTSDNDDDWTSNRKSTLV